MQTARLAMALALLPSAVSAEGITAVMSAFPPEWAELREDVQGAESTQINGNEFVTGTLEGQDVVLFLSGVSMVNAAMTTQLALDNFEIDRIVFSGIAGGVDPALNIGDVVVPDQWGQYLEGVFGREAEGQFAIPPFLTSDFPNFGMMFTSPVTVTSGRPETSETRFWFTVDSEMLALAEEAATTVELAECNPGNECLSKTPQIVVGGNGVSGSRFVDNAEFREFAFGTFQARVLDMESAAVAHVAFANQVPFIAFRSLSDLAGGGEGANEMATFMSLASQNSAEVVKAFLKALP
ncbi:5'-methylthioadenosine/S-adenosylhomocysteine nucleosidase [Pseudoruegeria sp. HB172150]|uniref:5'-methylthioadenosine/S-adenosylhomocysteine nucleosidase n=1 Tax=Pseudoruegeria sp. HB172150 TaxID=2721164 RepID=UPI00155685AD|nr:5'-methylthioadenosine/S-adenosylhomocysteine nucleosidase [Pseudoruegeria sp. HB172150]